MGSLTSTWGATTFIKSSVTSSRFRSRKNDKWDNIKNLTPKENHLSKTKMNLDDSLAAACEQLWRAAVSVAALKYIAGLVNTEWNGLTIKTEAEGAIKLHENESQDKTENSKNHENIIDRLAAEIELNNVEDDGSENEETDDSILENNEIEESILDQNDLKET